jgi:hypothetical protein
MFGTDFGGQISWLLPAALILAVAGLIWTAHARRVDRTRAALVVWGGSVVVTALAFSFGQGIIHPYYSVALGPGIGALIGIGVVLAWRRRDRLDGRVTLALALGVSAAWSYVLLNRDPAWHPWLRWLVVGAGALAAGCALAGIDPAVAFRRTTFGALLPLALVSGLAGPLAYSLDAATTPTSGAIPAAGPSGAFAAFGGGGRAFHFGGGGGFGPARFARGPFVPGASGGGASARPTPTATPSSGPSTSGSGASGSKGTGFSGLGLGPGGSRRFGRFGRSAGGPFGPGAGGGGGLLNGSTVSPSLVKALEAGGGHYTWLIATTGSEEAAGYQLATREPVMAIGGFNGTDPAPTLAQFEADVRAGRIHWYLDDGAAGAFGGASANDASAIASWVTTHFRAETIDGLTLYDVAPSS